MFGLVLSWLSSEDALNFFDTLDDTTIEHIFSYIDDFISKVRMTNTCKRFTKLKCKITSIRYDDIRAISAIRNNDIFNNYELVSHYRINTLYYDCLGGLLQYSGDGNVEHSANGYFHFVFPIEIKDATIITLSNQTENKITFDDTNLHFRKGIYRKTEMCTMIRNGEFVVTGKIFIYEK